MQPKVSVVILNYNTRDLLIKYLPSVLETQYSNLEIIVADNNSPDDSVAVMKAQFPQVKLIEIKENFGYAGGYNRALAQVNSDYFVLLNSDVEVPKNWLQPMVDLALKNPETAAIQPKIKDLKRKTYFEYAGAAGGYLDKFGYPFCKGRVFYDLEEDSNQYQQEDDIFWASGAALFIKASVWNESGGLDELFFAHMEEIDLCWRIQNMGYRIQYCPNAEIYHLGGGTLSDTSNRKTFLNFRNGLMLLHKNLPFVQKLTTIPPRLMLDGLAGLNFIKQGKFDHCWAIIRAHFAYYGLVFRGLVRTNKHAQKPTKLKGYYTKSIVWQYFVKGVKKFSGLNY